MTDNESERASVPFGTDATLLRLCDLRYIEAKCLAGMAADLRNEYCAATLAFGCVCCRRWSVVPNTAAGNIVPCPACKERYQLNPFVIAADWRPVAAAWRRHENDVPAAGRTAVAALPPPTPLPHQPSVLSLSPVREKHLTIITSADKGGHQHMQQYTVSTRLWISGSNVRLSLGLDNPLAVNTYHIPAKRFYAAIAPQAALRELVGPVYYPVVEEFPASHTVLDGFYKTFISVAFRVAYKALLYRLLAQDPSSVKDFHVDNGEGQEVSYDTDIAYSPERIILDSPEIATVHMLRLLAAYESIEPRLPSSFSADDDASFVRTFALGYYFMPSIIALTTRDKTIERYVQAERNDDLVPFFMNMPLPVSCVQSAVMTSESPDARTSDNGGG